MARSTAHDSLWGRLTRRFVSKHERHDDSDDNGDHHDDMRRAGDDEPDPQRTFDKLLSITYRSGQCRI